jgi:hypothetical protein
LHILGLRLGSILPSVNNQNRAASPFFTDCGSELSFGESEAMADFVNNRFYNLVPHAAFRVERLFKAVFNTLSKEQSLKCQDGRLAANSSRENR